ncbi:MAG: histidine phosphatase family protein [Bacilli bacterium]|nr:histidine phosphatase family protein [Bacilli bacterium]
MITLYLIRHLKTEGFVKKYYYGASDIDIIDYNEYGLNHELEEIKSIYRNKYNINQETKNNYLFYSTGMKRCNHTLNILFDCFNYKIINELHEIDFGIFELKSFDELKNMKEFQEWMKGDNFDIAPLNGESEKVFRNRIITAFKAFLKDMSDNSNVVFSMHGGTIYEIMNYLFLDEGKKIEEWIPDFGKGYVLYIDEDIKYENIQ